MIPNAIYFEQVKAMLDAGKTVKIRVVGTSMLPSLHEGDIVVLQRPGSRDLSWGRIVLACYTNRYVLHRVVGVTTGSVILAGDHNMAQHERVSRHNVIAVALEAYRNDRPLHINSKARVLNVWLWNLIRLIRQLAFGFLRKCLK